jgi:hypothetical protein
MAQESVRSRRGMVAASHRYAAEAGREVLAEGGNALEAALATGAAIVVAYPHMNHLGGDGFWLFREPSGRVRYIEACGYAGARATRELYREAGLEQIPARGPLAALTVPGLVGGWMLLYEAARDQGGRLPPSAPGARHAPPAGGHPVSCPSSGASPPTAARRSTLPASPEPSSSTASRRRRARRSRPAACPIRWSSSPVPVSTISIVATLLTRSRPTLNESAAPSRGRTWSATAHARASPSRCRCARALSITPRHRLKGSPHS